MESMITKDMKIKSILYGSCVLSLIAQCNQICIVFNIKLKINLRLVWLFLAVPWLSLQFVIVVFPDHTHLLFLCKHFYQTALSI